ncbi:hypothetical protein E2C01_077708 [Portunus trituberculatus]|uniref:Uncharacterized protein n=1 Tax=Portunus trituberculatus TaxID=210409 RepID=A0A5B7IM14_PORTR|nr:hypothetical protein [Portunus trituberculatus]
MVPFSLSLLAPKLEDANKADFGKDSGGERTERFRIQGRAVAWCKCSIGGFDSGVCLILKQQDHLMQNE